ncbi:uncharacterized protein BO66DRAFT_465508 [Aspergillus aculeatinus CBS 121060]|uniref:Uncharacterized protein n=1 Tax=Aspergillus aculeatinus CBS 121060 TaxID=1448322 RepID=A0ACD1HHE4_9EURO|nr:hypothetical protein BO66DRAFT_465508 [Aspergillus aculeatinus CBS 121060]RAH73010.1 hypothetical protein BO66DRAFT_465508 [Aspergillus aculeatinus CBS 121060]
MEYKHTLSPPFSQTISSDLAGGGKAWNIVLPATSHGRSHCIARSSDHDVSSFVLADLDVSRLNAMHSHLWYAGRARCCQALHRQRMIDRQIVITEQADLHMVWYESRIFLKPVPRYLLDHQFWDRHIRHEALHSAASGFLLSYTWLISHPSDLQIAHELKLIPTTVSWQAWTVFVEDLLSHVDFKGYANVNKRYRYGELRLFRLNTIYRLTHLSLESFLGGYLSMYD